VTDLGAVPAGSNPVPEPIAIAIWGVLGAAGAAAMRRHKQAKGRWSEENRQAIFQVIEHSR
jgi:post-segregation antitoxin (ccd killing protein)